jgi:hypothetical protein
MEYAKCTVRKRKVGISMSDMREKVRDMIHVDVPTNFDQVNAAINVSIQDIVEAVNKPSAPVRGRYGSSGA